MIYFNHREQEVAMKNMRKYGRAPFSVAVIHGGPGAAGEMAPVAQELSKHRGTLEPLQKKTTVDGQIKELASIIANHGDPPLTIIGHSWGAWLAIMYAVHSPRSVKKVILVSSGPFEERYVPQITTTRLSRMSDEEQRTFQALINTLNDPHATRKDAVFARVGLMLLKTDSYKPLPGVETSGDTQYRIFEHVWKEADEMRRSGALLGLARHLQCPVVAIHGDFDPHPSEGVKQPLSKILKDFTFILLENCGHYPWLERYAKKEFYEILEKELRA
jgi:pimeloyl-ACP methyl ester carboxylesterase